MLNNLTPEQVERFLIFSKVYETIENSRPDVAKPLKNYEKRFLNFEKMCSHLPTSDYRRVISWYLWRDLVQHNKNKPKKVYVEGNEESYDPQLEHMIDRKNFWKKAQAKLTNAEAQLLQDHLTGISGKERAQIVGTSQQAQSKMLKNVYIKLNKLVVDIS